MLRWAIIGNGIIAGKFANDLGESSTGELIAVGSRSAEHAEAFAQRCGAPRWYGSHAELFADDDVDVVYIAVPHTAHHAVASAALKAGKPVLLEKPFTLNRAEADDLRALAAEKSLFLMEAMWSRFLPHMRRIRALVDDGRLGDLRTVVAEHGVWFRHNPSHRMFDPRLGGGALLDLGIYPVSFAAMLLGRPTSLVASSQTGPTGVDAQTTAILHYPGDRQAVATSTMQAWLANRACVAGTDARIDIDGIWYRPTSFTIHDRDGSTERHEFPVTGNGLQFQIDEVARCIGEGLTESPTMSLAESCDIMGTLDNIRAQIDLRYPGE